MEDLEQELNACKIDVKELSMKVQLANFEISYLKEDINGYERRETLIREQLNAFELREDQQLQDFQRRISYVKCEMNSQIEHLKLQIDTALGRKIELVAKLEAVTVEMDEMQKEADEKAKELKAVNEEISEYKRTSNKPDENMCQCKYELNIKELKSKNEFLTALLDDKEQEIEQLRQKIKELTESKENTTQTGKRRIYSSFANNLYMSILSMICIC